MKIIAILILPFFLQQVPFKPKDDFEVKLEYKFKQRPPAEKTSIHFDETREEHERRTSAAMLPYLVIRLNLLKLPSEEVKVRIQNNMSQVFANKKVRTGTSLVLDMGFTDDIKDRVSAHEYNLFFVSSDKKELSRIQLLIEEDGTFLVNGEKRGKF